MAHLFSFTPSGSEKMHIPYACITFDSYLSFRTEEHET